VKSILVRVLQFSHVKFPIWVYGSDVVFLCHAVTFTYLPNRSCVYIVKLKFSPQPPMVRVSLPLMFSVGFVSIGTYVYGLMLMNRFCGSWNILPVCQVYWMSVIVRFVVGSAVASTFVEMLMFLVACANCSCWFVSRV